MATAYWAHGTVIKGKLGTNTFSNLAAVRSVTGPGLTRDVIDVTAHDTSNGYRTFVSGLRDGGEITFDIIYDPAETTHDATNGLIQQYETDTADSWSLVFPDNATTNWNFDGFVTGFEPTEPIDDALTAAVTIKVTGQPVLN